MFDNTAASFRVYWLSGSSGFGFLTWKGYGVTRIDEAIYPAASWLLGHGLWYDTDLQNWTTAGVTYVNFRDLRSSILKRTKRCAFEKSLTLILKDFQM